MGRILCGVQKFATGNSVRVVFYGINEQREALSNISEHGIIQFIPLSYPFFSGYANAKIFKCDNPKCPRPVCYTSGGSSKDDSFPCYRPSCTGRFQLVRHISFVDCPGHDILMATMLNGAAVMDAAFLLIAGKTTYSLLTYMI